MYYAGEGGEKPYRRRLQRMASSADLELASTQIHATFDVAPIQSPTFQLSLQRDLSQTRPALVIIDPFYAFHGSGTNAASLYEEGELLSGLSSMCLEAGASLMLVNHFNQTGKGAGLKRITMAGSAEWVDSWILLSHRDRPAANVAAGEFFLSMEIGSRQWGGRELHVDLTTGAFNHATGTHDGDVIWNVRSSLEGNRGDREVVLRILKDEPWRHSKTALAERLGGRAARARELVDRLESAEEIRSSWELVDEGDRRVHRDVYALADQPRPDEET